MRDSCQADYDASGVTQHRHSGGGQCAGGAAVADGHDPHDVPHCRQGHSRQGAVPCCAHMEPHPGTKVCVQFSKKWLLRRTQSECMCRV
jgi:hypothetical protein